MSSSKRICYELDYQWYNMKCRVYLQNMTKVYIKVKTAIFPIPECVPGDYVAISFSSLACTKNETPEDTTHVDCVIMGLAISIKHQQRVTDRRTDTDPSHVPCATHNALHECIHIWLFKNHKNACLRPNKVKHTHGTKNKTRLLLARLISLYCFARGRLSSVVVNNAAGGRAGRPPVAWAVGRPTLHGGPVRLRPIRATPC